jgi:CRISPR/Cas system CSM-associated protein Csm2 small subunit
METKVNILKKRIENKSIGDSFLVMSYYDNSFLAYQYINEIAKIKNLEKVSIDTLDNIKPANVFGITDNNLYILHVEEFDSDISNFQPYKNYVVICNKISERTRSNVVETAVYCALPKLLEWQIIDYIKFTCNGLNDNQVRKLYSKSNGDIYKAHKESLKISIFQNNEQLKIFEEISIDNGYDGTSKVTVYSLATSLINKNIKGVSEAMVQIGVTDIDAMSLVGVLHKNLKHIVDIKLSSTSTAQSLGMTTNQFDTIYNTYINVSGTRVINMLEFITSIDYKLKSGLLPLSDNRLLDYVVCNMLAIN